MGNYESNASQPGSLKVQDVSDCADEMNVLWNVNLTQISTCNFVTDGHAILYEESYGASRRQRICEHRHLHDQLWKKAAEKSFAFPRLYHARNALTMVAQGVTEFATVNVKDYESLGFERVWNPLPA